jgi:non-ribosomal peptide synthase protein (TIGR01720 family)
VTARLGRQETDALLHRVPAVYRTQINDVLLAALGRVLAGWTGQDKVLIGMEGHGREDIIETADLSQTVGWFTTEYPVLLDMPADPDWGQALKSVKEQLRAVPHRGLSYGALRYLSQDGSPATALRDTPRPQISFNYLGLWGAATAPDSLFQSWHSEIGEDADPATDRTYLLTLVGAVADGQLEIGWTYPAEVYDQATIAGLAGQMTQALGEIIAHCARPGAGGRTPSDFPLARLDQETVDRLAGDGRAVEDIWPLTPLQAGMLFHNLVDPGSGAYLDQARLHLRGVSDPQALGQAWQAVVDRTPILRSRVSWEDTDEPLLIIHRQVTVPITRHDWRARPEPERDGRLQQLLAGDRAAGMDLTQAPLLRVAIAQLPGDETVLAWTCHHIILDGWSLGQVIAEVFEHYAAITGNRPPQLVSRRPFRDYLHWLTRRDRQQAEHHWRQLLSGFDSPTPLPYDHAPTQAHHTESSQAIDLTLTAEQSAQLHQTARHAGLTVNTIVQGAWALLLSRYSGQPDVVFGTTVAGRPAELPGVESMIGMFINTIPTRIRAHGGQNVLAWLRDLQDQQTESRRFDHIALAQLQAWADLPPATNLFNSIVVFENYPIDEHAADTAGLRIGEIHATDTTNYPLTLLAYHADQLHLQLTYDPALFGTQTAERIARHLQVLLKGIAASPDQPVNELSLLSDPERRQVLGHGVDADLEVPEATFAELFEAQAERTPKATALVCGDTVLTFAEFNTQANKLARLLVSRGAGPERVVAVALPRSAGMVAAMLAVAKAGAVYLPVDPDLPPRRIELLLADAAPAVLVTAPGTDLPGDTPQIVVDDVGMAAQMACLAGTNLTAAERGGPLRPGNAAYVIYTSGTSGTPKGVMVDQRSLANLAASQWHTFLANTECKPLRAALTASFSFDASWEGVLLLAGGHELHVISDEMRMDPGVLIEYVADHHIDLINATPTYLERLLAAGLLTDGRHHPGTVLVGGEPLGERLWQQLADAPGTRAYNFYGPTECTVDATCCPVTPGTRPSVGRPLPNLGAYVAAAGAGRCGRGAVPGRAAGGPRLPGPAGADRGPVRGVPVRAGGQPDVRDRRPDALD